MAPSHQDGHTVPSDAPKRSAVIALAWIVGSVLGAALILLALILGLLVYPYAQRHHWGVGEWSSTAALVFSLFGLLGIFGGIAGVLLTAQYVLANNRIQLATERTLEATLHANELNRRTLDATEAMVGANREMVAEMRETRLAEIRARVLLTFRIIDAQIWLAVGNYGGGAAVNVRFTFVEPLVNAAGQVISDEPTLSMGFPVLPPGEPAEKIFFENYRDYFDLDYLLGNRASSFEVTVTYAEPAEEYKEVAESVRLSLQHLAPTPLLDYQLPQFEEEVERAKRWSHAARISDEDRSMIEKVECAISQQIAAGTDLTDAPSIHRAIQEQGWDLSYEAEYRGLLQVATKNQGPDRGRVIVAAGPDARGALLRLLQAALRVDSEQASATS